MPVPNVALNTSRSPSRQASLSTMLVGIARPSRSRRYPVSIGCCTMTRTSNASPFWTEGGTCTRPIISAMASHRFVEAGGRGHEHLLLVQLEAPAREAREHAHGLRAGEAHARGD